MVAVAMNGEPLPAVHGFPARLVVPGLYGYVSATKWLSAIELKRWEEFEGYWIPRGWARRGPIKTQSRIDVPAPSSTGPRRAPSDRRRRLGADARHPARRGQHRRRPVAGRHAGRPAQRRLLAPVGPPMGRRSRASHHRRPRHRRARRAPDRRTDTGRTRRRQRPSHHRGRRHIERRGTTPIGFSVRPHSVSS